VQADRFEETISRQKEKRSQEQNGLDDLNGELDDVRHRQSTLRQQLGGLVAESDVFPFFSVLK